MPGSFGISDGHFGEGAGFSTGFLAGVFLGDLQPEPDGFSPCVQLAAVCRCVATGYLVCFNAKTPQTTAN